MRAWQAVKDESWTRDGGRCRHCAAAATDPHHLRYRSHRGVVDTVSNTVWLCRRCHDAVHERSLLVWFTDANDLVAGVTFVWRDQWDGLERAGYRHGAWKEAA